MYIAVVTLCVKDIDRAIDFYTNKLGWVKTMDAPMGDGTRWVTVAPKGGQTAFTLSTDSPRSTSENDGFFSGVVIEVEDVDRTFEQFKKIDIEFTEVPRVEPWGGWAMFKDSEGNVHGLHSSVRAGVSSN
jgi:lactoylglutathione lyase